MGKFLAVALLVVEPLLLVLELVTGWHWLPLGRHAAAQAGALALIGVAMDEADKLCREHVGRPEAKPGIATVVITPNYTGPDRRLRSIDRRSGARGGRRTGDLVAS